MRKNPNAFRNDAYENFLCPLIKIIIVQKTGGNYEALFDDFITD